MGIVNRRRADSHLSRRGLDRRIEAHLALVQRQCHGERLQGRAGLEGVGQRPVAQLGADQLDAVVRVVGRQIRQRQYFAGADVEHHHATCLGAMLLERLLEITVGEVLHLRIQGERNILPFPRRMNAFDILHDIATPVLDDATRAVLAGQLAVESQFDALLAGILDAGESQHVRHHLARRVVAPVFVLLMNPRQFQRRHPVRQFRRQLALDVDEFAFGTQPAIDLAHVHVEQGRQPARLCRRQLHIFRNCPDRAYRCGHRQHVAIAIGNAPSRSGNVDHPLEASTPLVAQKFVVEPLQIKRTHDQRKEGAQQHHQHETLPPKRQAFGQQRTSGELDRLHRRFIFPPPRRQK